GRVALYKGCLRLLRGEGVNPSADYLGGGVLADYRRAAELNPDDIAASANLVGVELAAAMAHLEREKWKERAAGDRAIWNALPDRSKQAVKAALDGLERLAGSEDKDTAAAAAENFALLNGMVMSDFRRGEEVLRRAISLNQDRETAWELLYGMLNLQDRPED